MKRHTLLTEIAVTVMAFYACNDETLDIGNTLTSLNDKMIVSSADFAVNTRTIIADSVLVKSSYCYLGNLKDFETGTYVSSSFMTQMNLMESFSLPPENTIATQADGRACADSCLMQFILAFPSAYCDTLAAIKFKVSELSQPMEENQFYYSNFNPVTKGLIREDGLQECVMFTHNGLTATDSETGIRVPFLVIRLDKPYTDKRGVTYKNYGTYIMRQYYDHPEYFRNSYTFTHNVCPGFYLSITDGEGVYTEVQYAGLAFSFDKQITADSVHNEEVMLAGTNEVLQTTTIINDKSRLQQLASDNTCTYIKAPAGLFTEVTLPVDEIFSVHQEDSIMTATISFQHLNNQHYDKEQQVPTSLLMVPKDSLHTFFEKSRNSDNLTTYTTNYNSTTNLYSFSNISSLVTMMHKQKIAGQKIDTNWSAHHPDWNKVVLVPIKLKTSTSSTNSTTITGYEHCLTIASTKLAGGSDNPYDPVRIKIVYGKFN